MSFKLDCALKCILRRFAFLMPSMSSMQIVLLIFKGGIDDLLLTFCLLLLPLWESVIVLCFVVRYFMSILVLQSS